MGFHFGRFLTSTLTLLLVVAIIVGFLLAVSPEMFGLEAAPEATP